MLARFVAAFLVFTSFSHTQTRSPEIMTEVSNDKMRSILQGLGFEFTEQQSENSYAIDVTKPKTSLSIL